GTPAPVERHGGEGREGRSSKDEDADQKRGSSECQVLAKEHRRAGGLLDQDRLHRQPAKFARCGQRAEDQHDGRPDRSGGTEDGGHKVLGEEAALEDARRNRALDAMGRQRHHKEEHKVGQQEDPGEKNADEDPVGPALTGFEVLGAKARDHRLFPSPTLGSGFFPPPLAGEGRVGVSVNSRNTSSSDCSETRSSLTSTPSETSRRLIDAACDGSTDRRSVSPSTRTCSGLTIASTKRRAWSSGVARMRSALPPLRARSSSTVPSATSWPFAITPTRSQVSSTSLSRWLDSRTVRPPCFSSLISARISIVPCGSSPLVGSSRIRRSGAFKSAAATPSRCFIPVE